MTVSMQALTNVIMTNITTEASGPQEARESEFDPLAPETFDSPHEAFSQLRERCPVAWSNAWNGFWAFFRYDDVCRAATDYRTYTTTVQNVIPKVAFTGRRPPLHLDPPEHTAYRRALNPLLSEEAIAPLEAPIRSAIASLLEPLLIRGEGDICADFSTHMTIRVFAEWMRLDARTAEQLSQIGREYNVAVQSAQDELVRCTSLQLYEIAKHLIAERKAAPRDPAIDPVCALLAARYEGQPLPEDMIVGTVRQVLVVGIIAPTIMIGSIVTHLCRDQELQQALRADRAAIPAALEEFLRLYTPYRGFARTVTHEVTVRGRSITPGEPIALVYAAANRDPEVFDEPNAFRADRPNISDSLAFGRGPHHCMGMALARLELRVALEELLGRTTRFELTGPVTPTRMPEIGALKVPMRLWRS